MFIVTLKSKSILFFLLGILLLGSFLRVYKVNQIPPSLSWDEAAVGYNAWAIARYGKDEWGQMLPLTFRSFEDVKKPVNVYLTSFFVLILGLSEFTTRLPSIVFGVLNILLIYYLSRKIFRNEIVALFSSFFLAISPFNIHFSRFNHEANIALFFLMAGILFFIKTLEDNKYLNAFLSGLFFITSMLTYNASLIIVPILFLMLVILNFKKFWDFKLIAIFGLVIGILITLVFIQPEILGSSRVSQVSFSDSDISQTKYMKKTNNLILARGLLTLDQYFSYFSPKYLFVNGDSNPRLSIQGVGEFYPLDSVFLIVGLSGLLFKINKWMLFIFFWALIAPLPGSLVKEAPHAGRGLFMMGSWHMIAAYGVYMLFNLIKGKRMNYSAAKLTEYPFESSYCASKSFAHVNHSSSQQAVWYSGSIIKIYFLAVFLTLYLGFSFFYLNKYFSNYNKNYPNDWQYGMKQIIEYIKDHPEYNRVYMTNVRSQPYIFFLYYLKYPLPKYLANVAYNHKDSRSYNLVFGFDKFIFDDFDPVESIPYSGYLYILSSSQYDGLRYKSSFIIKKVINYPDGANAFFIVSKS